MLEIKTISRSDRSLLKKFIMLPAKLHKDHKNWVPPIYRDEWNYFDSKKNGAFLYSDHEMLLALKDGQPVGRIMGIINHRHNEAHQLKTSRFSFFECIDNQDIAHVLFDYMETWSKSKGMKSIIGPFGMYYHDPTGFLIEGYEYKPAVATNYNFRYQIRLVENEGFLPETDLVVYRIQLNEELPIIYNKIYERAIRETDFRLLIYPIKKY